ncbi:hypothetical protein L1049_027078 [Liquidambar formosana]|uniref:Embryo sac development arrest 6 n=1 Tax=Liquidambar formosana TaxID=63359 RepID=A0AAP0R230_LIQFO
MLGCQRGMNPSRRVLTPWASNKRKEREGFDALKPSTTKILKPSIPRPGSPANPKKPSEPASRNLLLAGYLAHEFLTKGTLLGERWDPARAEAVPVSADTKRVKSSQMAKAELPVEKYERYVEVASLLKADGAHIAGVVNPTQLAAFLHL